MTVKTNILWVWTDTVERVYFARIYCSRMANQNFREHVFFANGRKAVTTEDCKYPKNTQNTRKGPKTVKIINIVFFANGIQIAKNKCARNFLDFFKGWGKVFK